MVCYLPQVLLRRRERDEDRRRQAHMRSRAAFRQELGWYTIILNGLGRYSGRRAWTVPIVVGTFVVE